MRVLILTDAMFASRERTFLERLEVGLADEGVRVIHAVPESVAESLTAGLGAPVLAYEPRSFAITRPLAVARVTRALTKMLDVEDRTVDVVHVFGGTAWALGADMAKALGAALALEVWRSGLVDRARGLGTVEARRVLVAPDPAIERALTAGTEQRTVRLAAWGAYAEPRVRPLLRDGATPTAMIVGAGRDRAAYAAVVQGLAHASRAAPDLMIFCDALAARRAGLWALARRLGLLPRFSLIDELEARRDLLLQGDLLIQPDAHGEARSVILDAMGAGVLVVAAADPMVSVLIDARTARLAPQGDVNAWGKVLTEVLDDRARARALAESAHVFVRSNRRASDHVRAVLRAYEAAGVRRPE
ncbi:MAG: hypothetical protein HBSAPP03_20810 [Phycisphaerae bacterium]|nr:MAG: hypothetical protein HBSAPP03_20810 [Phycisphaerae bacterium]